MFRKQDLTVLQNLYNRASNDIVIVYGNKRTGKESLISEFIKDKEFFIYKALHVEETLQMKFFAKELNNQSKVPGYLPDDPYKSIVSYITGSNDSKKVIIYDDFMNLVKDNSTLINFLIKLISEDCNPGSVMFILTCDDIFDENENPVNRLGKKAYEISCLLKIEPYSFNELKNRFPEISPADLIALYAVLGGNENLWNYVDNNQAFKDFIITRYLDKNSIFFKAGEEILPNELRSPSMYNTVLYYISSGINKLGDIHDITGIDRAKLAVYIKTLISFGLIKKAESPSIGDSTGYIKGIYYISDPFVHFWYQFIFPNISTVMLISPERFYRRFIEPYLHNYLENIYPYICKEKVQDNTSHTDELSIIEIIDYPDKMKAIDFILRDENDELSLCACRYGAPHMAYKRYEDIQESAHRNHIKYKKIMLFSAGAFDQKLTLVGSVNDNVVLFEGFDERLR